MNNWKLLTLEHDNSSKQISEFFRKSWKEGTIERKVCREIRPKTRRYRGVNKDKLAEKIGKTVGNTEGKILTLYGDGNSHHYTYGLCDAIASKRSDDFLYIHLDHHTDSEYDIDNILGCGSFVENILKDYSSDIMILGAEWGSMYTKRTVIGQKGLFLGQTVKNKLKEKPQKDVYLSIDLDVINRKEIITSYDQGDCTLGLLLNAIKIIQDEKNIISADILGYSDGRYGYSNPATGILTYAIVASTITGKDTRELEELHHYFKKEYSKEIEPEKVTEEFRNLRIKI